MTRPNKGAGRIVAVPQLTDHRRALIDSLAALYGKCQESDDEVVVMHTFFLLIACRHGLEEARRLFAYISKPKFASRFTAQHGRDTL